MQCEVLEKSKEWPYYRLCIRPAVFKNTRDVGTNPVMEAMWGVSLLCHEHRDRVLKVFPGLVFYLEELPDESLPSD